MKTASSYPISRSPLNNIRRRKKAAEVLQAPIVFLEKFEPEECYKHFTMPKADGSSRDINAPIETLKKVQKRLLDLLRRIERPEWLISSRRGMSYINNARYHKDNPYVLTIDIRKFYDSCIHKHVNKLFRETFQMSPDVAHIFSKLTTFNLLLPTGAPTSQLVAFFAYSSAFYELYEIAKNAGCRFSLYVDDMTFSSDAPISLAILLPEINRVLNQVGHRMKYGKIKYFERNECKIITGAVIDKRQMLKVPNKLRFNIIQGVHQLKDKAVPPDDKRAIARSMIGRIHAARNIEPGLFPEAFALAKAVENGKQ